MRMCHFWAQNGPFILKIFFFWYKSLLLSSTYWPFSLCKIKKKNHTADPVLWWCTIFGPKMVHLPKKIFGEIVNIILIYLLATFIVQNLKKKISSGSRVTSMCNFWAQSGPFPQMRIFSENLSISLVSFIHAYLHAKNQCHILIY